MVVHETYRDADGDWVQPAEVRIEQRRRRAPRRSTSTTGAPIEIGPIEKMSKSKKNTVDPDDIIASYGADTARWFMLSDSPPERDVIWTEEGVQGAAASCSASGGCVGEIAERRTARDGRQRRGTAEALAIRKAAHRALAAVEEDIERLRFNRGRADLRAGQRAPGAARRRRAAQRRRTLGRGAPRGGANPRAACSPR